MVKDWKTDRRPLLERAAERRATEAQLARGIIAPPRDGTPWRGFASMPPAEVGALASAGGKKTQSLGGRRYRMTPEQAKVNGRRGGLAKNSRSAALYGEQSRPAKSAEPFLAYVARRLELHGAKLLQSDEQEAGYRSLVASVAGHQRTITVKPIDETWALSPSGSPLARNEVVRALMRGGVAIQKVQRRGVFR